MVHRTEAGDEEIETQEDGPKEPDPEYTSSAYLPDVASGGVLVHDRPPDLLG